MGSIVDAKEALEILREVFAFALSKEEFMRGLPRELHEKFGPAIENIDATIKNILRKSRIEGRHCEEEVRIAAFKDFLTKMLRGLMSSRLDRNRRVEPLFTQEKDGKEIKFAPFEESTAKRRAVTASIELFRAISKFTRSEADQFFSYIWNNRDILYIHDERAKQLIDFAFKADDFRRVVELSLVILVYLEAYPDKPSVAPIVTVESKIVEFAGPFWTSEPINLKVTRGTKEKSFLDFCNILGEVFNFPINNKNMRNAVVAYQKGSLIKAKPEPPVADGLPELLPHAEEVLRRLLSVI